MNRQNLYYKSIVEIVKGILEGKLDRSVIYQYGEDISGDIINWIDASQEEQVVTAASYGDFAFVKWLMNRVNQGNRGIIATRILPMAIKSKNMDNVFYAIDNGAIYNDNNSLIIALNVELKEAVDYFTNTIIEKYRQYSDPILGFQSNYMIVVAGKSLLEFLIKGYFKTLSGKDYKNYLPLAVQGYFLRKSVDLLFDSYIRFHNLLDNQNHLLPDNNINISFGSDIPSLRKFSQENIKLVPNDTEYNTYENIQMKFPNFNYKSIAPSNKNFIWILNIDDISNYNNLASVQDDYFRLQLSKEYAIIKAVHDDIISGK